ncbi:MAG: DinB family protein [Anaerolineae bacterium]|nr:DinB family protein [Anaerolineae bacterium]
MTAINEILNQFERQFKTLDTLYDRVNDAAWAFPDQRIKGTWQWMAHLLETVEFYLGNRNEGFEWGHRFDLDWENAQANPIPSREAMRVYQKDVQAFALQVLGGKSDADLLVPESLHPWTGKTYLGKLLYLMRHTQQHIGDINRVLRMNGCDALEWH